MRSSPAAVRGTGTTGADRRHGVMLRLVGAGVMLTVMADTTATTLAVGVLRYTPAGAGMPLGDLVWLTSAAFIPIAALLATAGRWADLFGRRRVLAVGLVVFVLGGIATVAVEPWSYVLAARAVQGAGAAAMIPASLGLLLGELPESQRRGAIALWSSASGLGCLLMQAGGGWLAATVGWRALFIPDVIIGVALLIACVALPSGRRTPAKGMPDVLGAWLLAAGIAVIVLAISKAMAWGMDVVWLALAALALLGGAFAQARHHRLPAIDLALWRRPRFVWGWLATWGFGALSYGLLTVQPLYLLHLGYPMLEVAMWLTPTSVAVVVTSFLAGKIVKRVGAYGLIYAGSLLCGGACVLVLTQAGPTVWGLIASVVVGVGVGALAPGTSVATTLAARPHQYASAVGAATMARMVGGAVGIAVVSVVIDHPFMTGPFAGLAGALALCVAISVLIGALALTKITRLRPDPDDVMVKVPRRLLLELRMTLATVAAEADALLPVETRTPPTDPYTDAVPRPRSAEPGPLAGIRGHTN
ncbi:MFS transporter [Nonomuraea rubra]|uniref:MFS family permease n=1 Tax=Nonomuraea rubra TaxID=46180 RepID=A0A7X0U1V7_9ACTN|nr:MFS transporter [Nonomuraea rubra]MBB6552152.1 MFS family permease [Nonomuraea rubra]